MEFDRDPTPLRARRQFEQALEGAELPATHRETAQVLALLESLLERHPTCTKSLLGTMDLVRDTAESIEAIRFGGLSEAESLLEEAYERKTALTEHSVSHSHENTEANAQLLSILLRTNLSFGLALSYVERSLQHSEPREIIRLTRLAVYHYSKGVRRLIHELPDTGENPNEIE